jgi:DNA-binding transcriptional LysR family regulator
VLAEWAARLLDVAEQMDAGIATLRAESHAHLRVAASLTIAEQLLPGWLVAFNRSHHGRGGAPPDVTLAASNSETVAAMVRSGEADVGFVEGPRAPGGCRSRVIGHDELVLVVALGHPWAAGSTVVTPDLLARTALVTREAGSGTRSALEAALSKALAGAVHRTEPALILSTTAAVRAAVLAGAGPAVLSHLVVADDLATGRLRAVPITGLDLTRALRAIWLGSRTPPAGPVRDLIALATAPQG